MVPDRQSSQAFAGGLAVADFKNCIHEDKLKGFKDIWDPEDRTAIEDMLKNIGFKFYSPRKLYCFSSLQWVPHIMGKINSRVQDSVSNIEEQQEKIRQTVNAYTSANNTNSMCPTTSNRIPGKEGSTDLTHSVFAHYFVNTAANSISSEENSLQWIWSAQKGSDGKGVDVSKQSGQFTIKTSGFYFLYTHVIFKGDHSLKAHRVVKMRGDQRTKLLETVQGGSDSFMQGVFQLRTEDSLLVEATADKLDRSREKMSYFGLYLIRT